METNLQEPETNKAIHQYLRCLRCKNPLDAISQTQVVCKNSHQFSIDEGVLLLETEIELPQKFRWGSKLRDPNENLRLDKDEGPASNEQGQKRMENATQFIVTNSQKDSVSALDIATGRGLLMRKLLAVMHNSIVFLSDLDPDVLVGTNKLLENVKGSNVVVPIKVSATHLPFEDNSVSQVISFGVNNIRDTTSAFKEVYRILTLGGKFILTMSLLEKDSPSHKWLLTQEDKPGSFDVIDEWQKEVEKIGFKIVTQEVLFDGPAEKIPLDLTPREEGERFQDVGVVLTK